MHNEELQLSDIVSQLPKLKKLDMMMPDFTNFHSTRFASKVLTNRDLELLSPNIPSLQYLFIRSSTANADSTLLSDSGLQSMARYLTNLDSLYLSKFFEVLR